MKKILALFLFLAGISHAFYAEIGIGYSFLNTNVNGESIDDALEDGCNILGCSFSELGVELGLKAGAPILSNLYIAAAFEGVGHSLKVANEEMQINRYLVGPSVMYYPINHFQLSGTIGPSFASIVDDYGNISEADGMGFAFSVSAGYDFRTKGTSALIGGKFSFFTQEEVTTYGLSLFVRFLYK